MNVLVTGGSGLVGKELIKALLAKGHCVTALEHSTPVPFTEVKKIKGDIRDRECVKQLVEVKESGPVHK